MSYGITEDDKRIMGMIYDSRTQHAKASIESDHPNPQPPSLPTVDGETQVVELKGRTRTKVHRDDPRREGIEAWCKDDHVGMSTDREWKYRRLAVAREWREPCRICFPEGYDE